MSGKAPANRHVTRQQKDKAECDRLLNELHDLLDRNPSLAHLRAITPPRPGSENAAPKPSTDAELFTTHKTKLTAYGVSDLPTCEPNLSPRSQVSARFGDLIGPPAGSESASRGTEARSQVGSAEQVAARQARTFWRLPPPKTPD